MDQVFKKKKLTLKQGDTIYIGLVSSKILASVKAVVDDNVVIEIVDYDNNGYRVGTGKELKIFGYSNYDILKLPPQTNPIWNT
ncbi:hypothetical protein [Allomuricauda sp. M10]|uniref:hypothetical protein n=1 Tax=Allomuricauda sp. M10 TaxID=2683292 RepID=UPI001D182F45|nr:hypothetical protein [Muricauda sp. M10]